MFQKIVDPVYWRYKISTKIKLLEQKDRLDQQMKMCAGKIFANSYVHEYVPEVLPSYEGDGLMTYIDQLKYKEFISDPHAAIKNTY